MHANYLTAALLHFIGKDMMPFQIVEARVSETVAPHRCFLVSAVVFYCVRNCFCSKIVKTLIIVIFQSI